MLSKTVLVIYLIVGRSEVIVQGATDFGNEQRCQKEAEKYNEKKISYAIQRAECTFNLAKTNNG